MPNSKRDNIFSSWKAGESLPSPPPLQGPENGLCIFTQITPLIPRRVALPCTHARSSFHPARVILIPIVILLTAGEM